MSYHVLIIDDSRAMREMIARTLSLSGIELASVRQAANGKEALASLGEAHADLAVLDLNMPVMDGEQFLATVRSDPEHRTLAVVVASTETNPGRVRRLRLMGAEFVHKPFMPEDFCAAIVRATKVAPGV